MLDELWHRPRAALGRLTRRQQTALTSWSAFTATFIAVRGITYAIKDSVGPFHNVILGGKHLRQGRLSVDIAIAVIASGGSYLAARQFWHDLIKGRKP